MTSLKTLQEDRRFMMRPAYTLGVVGRHELNMTYLNNGRPDAKAHFLADMEPTRQGEIHVTKQEGGDVTILYDNPQRLLVDLERMVKHLRKEMKELKSEHS